MRRKARLGRAELTISLVRDCLPVSFMAYNVIQQWICRTCNKMIAVLGWLIIVTAFFSFSMMILWPGFRLVRRSHPGSKAVVCGYVASVVACSVVLWFVIPLAVHGIFARTVH